MSGMMVAALSDCVESLHARAASKECHGVLLRSNVPGKLCPGVGPAELVERRRSCKRGPISDISVSGQLARSVLRACYMHKVS